MIAVPLTIIRPVRAVLASAVLIAGLGAGAIAPASAQDQPSGAPPAAGAPARGRHHMAEALMTLGLSDGQKNQIRGIMADARAKNHDADPQTRHANFKAAFAKIETVLTPNQRTQLHAKLDELRKEQPAPPPQS